MTIIREKFFLRSLVCLATSLLLSSQASAQLHLANQPDARLLAQAEEQFEQGQYRVAAQSAKRYIDNQPDNINDKQYNAIDKANYYYAISKLKLDDGGSIDNGIRYLKSTSNPAYKQRTAYAIAQQFFKHNQLASAIPYYEMAGIYNLSNREIADAKFELAYCYFNIRKFDRAEPLLMTIKELEGKYYIPGNYYYGLLAYNQNNYADALKSFERISTDKEYKNIVPYYIAEIYYFTGNKEKALEEAKTLLARPEKLYYDNELHLLAAQILFEQQQYREALPYFEYYYQHTDRIRKEDLYEMAYCYYNGAEWDKAIDKFNQLSDTKDSLGQTAMYLLGDCYLKVNDVKSARNAFSLCADMNYIRAQKEAALLLAAKLSYKMGYNDDALNRVNELLADFPESKSRDEAKTLLSDLLIKTNNYEDAYTLLREVATKDALYYQVMQKVAYGYAMLQLQNGNLGMADSLLSLSLQRPIDEKYELAANYWKGELAYKMRRFADVITYSERFVEKASVNRKGEYLNPDATLQNAYVNMGYASMEQKNFEAAQWYFNQAQMKMSDSSKVMTAMIREADAVFMQKGYVKALGLYDKVIAHNGEDAAYAKFQKAIVLGVMNKRSEKIALLQSIVNATPASPYLYDARYELALAYIEEDKYQAAVNMLMPLTSAYDKSSLASKAWMKIGFCYQQMHSDEKAIEAYRHVVVEYPASEERGAALDALKSLYVENNRPEAYAQLLKENNIAATDDNSLDSTYYNAAEAQYASGNWQKAKQSLGEYLKQYPNGLFATKAHFYKAESEYQRNEMKEAVADYEYVLSKGWSEFAERSALKAANISMVQGDMNAALEHYTQLRSYALAKENLGEAYKGMMRANYNLKQYAASKAYADTLMALPGLDEAMQSEASYIKAKSLYETGSTEEAYAIFKKLTNKKGVTGAEANYYIAESYYRAGKLKEAEDGANATIKLSGGNEKLTVKTYLLLADILIKQKDYFNAKALLQSIAKNAKAAEYKTEAATRLDIIKELENKQGKLKQD